MSKYAVPESVYAKWNAAQDATRELLANLERTVEELFKEPPHADNG